jgi:hypothetical protein
VTQSRLEQQYLTDIGLLLARINGIEISVTCSDLAFENPDFNFVGYRISKWCSWDLILFADHHPLMFSSRPTSALFSHGVVRSRVVGAVGYQYDPARTLRLSRPVYDVLFEASSIAARWAEKEVPALKGRIRVVGDLKADKILEGLREVAAIDRSLLVMSTWGPNSLLELYGPELIEALADLNENHGWSLIISTHPNLWAGQERSWLEPLRALGERPHVEVLAPGAGWEVAIASSAIALSDHTSLLGYWTLTNRPVLLVSIPRDVVADGTLPALMYEECPVLSDVRNLASQLNHGLDADLPKTVQQASLELLDVRGSAVERILAILQGELLRKN